MSWDEYFYELAHVVASNSKCLSRKIGAVLVKNNVVIATGYNGPPRGIPHCDKRHNSDDLLCKEFGLKGLNLPKPNKTFPICPRRLLGYDSNEGLHLCPATHAEVNCIAHAAMLGIKAAGAQMYLTCGIPCKNCLAVLINAGIEEVICTSLEYYDDLSPYILKHSRLIVRTYGVRKEQ